MPQKFQNRERPWTQLHVLPTIGRVAYLAHDRKSRVWMKIQSLLIIFLILLVIVLLGIFFYTTKIVPTPSTKTVKIRPDVQSSSLVASTGKKITLEEDCYGIVPKFTIRKVKSFDRCSMLVSFESPYGSLIIDYRGNGGAAVSSDILMRKANKDRFEETLSTVYKYTFMVFRNRESPNYEKTAFLQLKGTTIGITLKSDSSLNYDTEFQEILSSFYCKNECTSATLDAL